MAKRQSQVAKTIAPVVGQSVLASLESRTDTPAATAGRGAGLKTGTKFSGQYLYDRFVANDKTEVTKLDIVRTMTELEVSTFKAVLADFVKVAKGYADNAVEKHGKDSAQAHELSAKLKTAQNHQANMRNAYGAIRFAPDELTANGYTESTGYLVMAKIASAALKAKGIKWDGSAIPSQELAQQRKVAAAESKALSEVMAQEPRKDGESLKDYVVRMDEAVTAKIKSNAQEREAKLISDLVAKFRKEAGSYLDDVIAAILTAETEQEHGEELTVEGSAPLAETAVKH